MIQMNGSNSSSPSLAARKWAGDLELMLHLEDWKRTHCTHTNRKDKDQLKGTTTTDKHRSIEYIQLQVQILHTTHTTSDARQHSINT